MTIILLCILGGICFIALLMIFFSLFRIKVWISTKSKREKGLVRIGYLADRGNQEVPEVHLSGNSSGKAIGRVKMGERNDNAYVELLDTPINDDTDKPRYRSYGFITQEGLIYKQPVESRKPVIIGYTARPSKPSEPTTIGERNWKSLWLKCRLNVYSGQPDSLQNDSSDNHDGKSKDEHKKDERIERIVFNSGVDSESESVFHEPTPSPKGIETSETGLDPEKLEIQDSEPTVTESLDSTTVENTNSEDTNEKNEEHVTDKEGKENKEEKEASDKKGNKDEKKNNKKRGKGEGKTPNIKPVSYVEYTGIHSSRKDEMPPEARAAAFGMLYRLYNKQNYQEYYKTPSFGWKDTALPAAFIYAIIYTIWYMIAMKVAGVRFIGFKFWLDIPIFVTYFALWAIVRQVKIECIEKSDTIQPKIDLFNKILGQRGFDITIIICSIITLAFTGTFYRFNFLPLALVMIIAVCINMTSRGSKERWIVKNPLIPEDEEEDDENELKNPGGDIEKIYEWELDSPNRKDVKGKLALYFDGRYITDLRFMNPFYNQRTDKSTSILIEEMFNYMREHKSISLRSRYVASQIKRITAQKQLQAEDALQFALDFVQEPNIRFTMNRDSHAINKYENYIRFPDETLYDKEADSSSKSFLASVIFHFLGHNVLFLYSRMQHHGALGIQLRQEWINGDKVFEFPLDQVTFEHNGKRYLFCETTSDGFRIGGTISGMQFEDFDIHVELPLLAKDVDEDNNETKTCLYNWDLDSAAGNKLHGSFTLEFDKEQMEALRSNNPFLNYGKDGENYEEKIRKIFQYIRQGVGRMDSVNTIATYIKQTVKEANLPELDLVQFALDFCQAPNITYRIDEESKGINFAKEYMRFPDEVLYDKEGDCDCKSSLTAALLNTLGYKVVILLSEKLGHAGIGVEYKPAWEEQIPSEDKESVLRQHNGITYVYCETTGDGLKVGQIKDGTIHDFEKIIEIQ